MKIMRDGQEIDPATFGVVVPMQRAKRMDDTAEWPPMGRDDAARSRDMLGMVIVYILVCVAFFAGLGVGHYMLGR